MFPTRIRYTGMSLPYHIGNGWFGGFLPALAFAIVAATGSIYSGLWYPIAIAAMSFVVGLIFLPETKDRDISGALPRASKAHFPRAGIVRIEIFVVDSLFGKPVSTFPRHALGVCACGRPP